MKAASIAAAILGLACVAPAMASPILLNSFENTLDGWTAVASDNAANFQASFVTSPGVTDGTYALAIGPTPANASAGPNYAHMIESPSTTNMTQILGGTTTINFDVYTPPASFGYYLQFDFDVNNNDTGYVSLSNYTYTSTNIGAETTISVPMPSALAAQLAASSNPTQLIVQIGGGYSADNETMYLDNLWVDATPVPEPASLSLLGLGGLALLRRRA